MAELDALGLSIDVSGRPAASCRDRVRRGAWNGRTRTPPRRGAILRQSQRKATGDVARKRKDLEKAEAEWKEWTSAVGSGTEGAATRRHVNAETAEAQINAIDDMREAAGRINELRHERIEKIERDIKAFEHDVAALVQAIAPQLAGADPEEAVLGSRAPGRRGEARVRDLRAAKDSDI